MRQLVGVVNDAFVRRYFNIPRKSCNHGKHEETRERVVLVVADLVGVSRGRLARSFRTGVEKSDSGARSGDQGEY